MKLLFERCGYRGGLLRENYSPAGLSALPLVGFAHEPKDSRSSCLAFLQSKTDDVSKELLQYHRLGAPIFFVWHDQHLEQWAMEATGAVRHSIIRPDEIDDYFDKNTTKLSPQSVYRAKTWGRLDTEYQLSFVDAGLLPVVETEIGTRLKGLVERTYQRITQGLVAGRKSLLASDMEWALKSAFWLLAAKILHDKKVPKFTRLDLFDVKEVFQRLSRHYGSQSVKISTAKQCRVLTDAISIIQESSPLDIVTTESLSYVYENAMVSDELRKELGTHSTPQYLVDYIVWKLAPWIQSIPEDDRHVFEPCCGHAAFLVSAIRLLKDISSHADPDRKQYLRSHIHGVEIDTFAIEIARLSLTLADIPNPNGWDLTQADMFEDSLLQKKASTATILLGNPPFENFSSGDREKYGDHNHACHLNKTTEVLHKTISKLPINGVFGFVIPQGLLHNKDAASFRSLLRKDFEIKEICLFPDKVFSFGNAESAIILGRRTQSSTRSRPISFRRVRKSGFDHFKNDYIVSSKQDISPSALPEDTSASLRIPDCLELWDALRHNASLNDIADIGKGLEFKGKTLPAQMVTKSNTKFAGGVRGFSGWHKSIMLHGLPDPVWLNLDDAVIRREVTGTTLGIPQILLNYAPVGPGGAWQLKALIDAKGCPVTSRFVTVRPKEDIPLEYFWALLNSPMSNAYAYCYTTKRDISVGIMRCMPIPSASTDDMTRIAEMAKEYHNKAAACTDHFALSGQSQCQQAKEAMVEIDAEVLRLYDLSPKMERALLDMFAGHKRLGVPFDQDRYYPQGFEPYLHLHEYLSSTYRTSLTKEMTKHHRTFNSPAVRDALRRAVEGFQE